MTQTASHLRTWLLLRLLCQPSQQRTLKELSADLNVSPKTVRRDICDLQKAGFPICAISGPHGRKSWACEANENLTGLRFTFEEAAALYLGRQLLEPLAGTFFFDAAQAAYRKIRTALTKETHAYLEQLSATFHGTRIGLSDYRQRGEMIDVLMVAIEDCRQAQLLYFSMNADSPKSVTVHPYGLVHHRGSLYLIAFVPEYNEIRHYKVDRIHDAEVGRLPFQKPDTFSLQEHLKSAFGIYQNSGVKHCIRVRFAPEVARYVQEHHWHDSQIMTQHPNGSLTLELQLSALEEFKSWILSFGAKAVVEEPDELREMLLSDLQTAMLAYSETHSNEYREVPR